MIYSARYPTVPLIVLLLIQIPLIPLNLSGKLSVLIYQLFLIVFLVFLTCVRFKFEINKQKLTYQILILSKEIYKKVLLPSEIHQIKFKRVGWMTRAATVKVKKGCDFRIKNFVPKQVYLELLTYAEINNVPTKKTKDFEILIKMK